MSESGWKNVALRDIATDIKDGTHGTHPRVESGVPFLSAKNIAANGKVIWTEEDDAISEAEYRLITSSFTPKAGDLLVTVVGSLGRTAIFDGEKVAFQRSVAFVRPNKEIVPAFLLQASATSEFARQLEQRSNATAQAGLYLGELAKVRIPLPPVDQQRRIAEILSTLDEAIEQTEALIAKMQQVKAGLMHDLFTRGVTPDGRLRPTREQAPELYKESQLGWIPKEWEVELLGNLAEVVSGVTLGSKNENNDEVGVPYLRVANVQDGYFDLQEVKTIRVSRAQFEKLQLRNGDVLMNEGGDFDKLGRGSVWQEEIKPCIHQNHVFRVRPRRDQLRSFYLAFWSQSEMGKKFFVLNSKQSTNLASINSTQLNRFPVALPSPGEQESIESRILVLNADFESLAQELAKFHQLKHGLMHNLLSGRVRVVEGESQNESPVQRSA